MRLRLLPATIGVVCLLLISKSAGLFLAIFPGAWALRDSVVSTAEAASAPESGHAAAARPAGSAAASQQATSLPPRPTSPPPPDVSEEERRLLQDLRTRRQQWDARDRVLTEREGVLHAAEQRLVARADELAALQSKLEQLEKTRADRDDLNWAGLVKVYEAMKPREAAAIFNDMDLPILLQLVDRMKEAKAAPIFGAMQPDRARSVTSQLAAKRTRTTTMDRPDNAASEGAPRP